MRRPLNLLLLTPLLGLLLGCDAMGGSTDSILAPRPTFSIVSRAPGPGREGVPTSASLVIQFNTDVDPVSVGPGSISANGSTYGTLEVKGAALTFTPVGGWTPGTSVAIAISPDITGINGVALGPVAVWGFKVAGDPPVLDTVQLVRARPR